MNIFIIPSWYPSGSNPIYGTFNHEQARLMAKYRPNWNVGVSTWGQGAESFLIHATRLNSIPKLFKKYQPTTNKILPNLTEYFAPAFSWTRKIKKGNIKGIIQANEANFLSYQKEYGTPNFISAQASYPASLAAQFLAEKYNIPYSVTIRMSPFPFDEFLENPNQLKPLIDHPLRSANTLIATSKSLKTRLEAFQFQKICVLNNPVDTAFFKPQTSTENYTILTVGRMENQKGIDLLLKAFSQINDKKWTLRIGGDGSLLEKYQSLAQELKIANQVEWLGQLSREQVLEEMQKCSFYMLSSRHETFGNVVVEAMACGKPVVATKCGGPNEIMSENTGILCDISVEGIQKGLEKMMQNHENYSSEKIREEAVQRFSPETWLNNLENIMSDL